MTGRTDPLETRARDVLERCRAGGITLAIAESCTGGLLAATLTAIEGSSAVVDRGFVVYSNAAKAAMLGVPNDLIATHGAVSARCAAAMARGALARSDASMAIALTGIAGPGGGTVTKPVGLVHLALASSGAGLRQEERVFEGNRFAIRRSAVLCALDMIASSVGAPVVGDDTSGN
ncbi:MAG: CinA family protein [Alphaproteobacteria bacterium]|nr:CinA family protein [Alphaproteobacteria bacterium]